MKKIRSYLPILLLSCEEERLHSLEEKKEYILGIELTCPAGSKVLKNIQTLIQGTRPFLLYIRPSATDGNIHEMVELVELCLFSQHYLRIGNAPVIAVLPDTGDDGSRSALDEDFFKHLQSQGWSSIVQWVLTPGLSLARQIDTKTSPLLVETRDFHPSLLQKRFLTSPDYLGSYVCFRDPAGQSPEMLEKAFADASTSAVGENLLWETSFTEYLSLKNAFAELNKRQAMLQEMLNNAESTISLIKSKYKEDYNLLFRWYHKEYEALPLWYKRFGQVLKVLKGQRSLRSLFDSRAKRVYHSASISH